MSGSSSYRTYESDDDSNGWSLSENDSIDGEDELSDELTLFNADEDDDEDSTTFEAFIKLSMRLKEEYNLREACVSLERCDKIWDTMQLLKSAQNEDEPLETNGDDTDDDDDDDESYRPKSSTDSTISEATSNAAPYIKYQPVQGNGNNALPNFYLSVKSQIKLYHCVTCGKQYSEKRGLRRHAQKEHGITIPCIPRKKNTNGGEIRVTRSQTPLNVDANIVDVKKENNTSNEQQSSTKNINDDNVYTCPLCTNTYVWKGSLVKHALDLHDIDVSECFRGLPKSANDIKSKTAKPKPREKQDVKPSSDKIRKKNSVTTNELGETIYDVCGVKDGESYRWYCPICEKSFTGKEDMRRHAKESHNIIVAKGKPRRLVKHEKEVSSNVTSVVPENSDSLEENKIVVRTTRTGQRPGPKSSKRKVGRPKRACAQSTSYTELTKDEEELMHKDICAATLRQTTKCLLCQKNYTDIRRHLKEYHRVNSPESVLPLQKKTEIAVKRENKPGTRVPEEEMTARENESPYKGFFEIRKIDDKQPRRVYKCLTCLYPYSSIGSVQRHLKRVVVDGVMKNHEAFLPGKQADKFWRDSMELMRKIKNNNEQSVDSSAFTDTDDKSMIDDNPSDDNERRKRGKSPSDSSTTSSDETTNPSKRRKIVDTNFEKVICDDMEFKDDKVAESVNEIVDNRGAVINDDDDDDDEDKTANQRDTRDSSDRDSGIGISITIKKRNNSYEVVDKDTDDYKRIGNADSKSVNQSLFSSDSSSELTTTTTTTTTPNTNTTTTTMTTTTTTTTTTTISRLYCRRDLIDYSRIPVFDPLDCGVDNVRSLTIPTTPIASGINNNDDVDDDVAIIDDTDVRVKNNEKDNRYCWKDELQRAEACTNMPGKVSSLKVLCGNALKRDDISDVMSNDHILHQCPVCCRCYPTERDVTVHMLEHKVSRSNFRTTRLHSIPSSALRRYPRKNV